MSSPYSASGLWAGQVLLSPLCLELLCQGCARGCPQLPLAHGGTGLGLAWGQALRTGTGTGVALQGSEQGGWHRWAHTPTGGETETHFCVGEGCSSNPPAVGSVRVFLGCLWGVLGQSPAALPTCPLLCPWLCTLCVCDCRDHPRGLWDPNSPKLLGKDVHVLL